MSKGYHIDLHSVIKKSVLGGKKECRAQSIDSPAINRVAYAVLRTCSFNRYVFIDSVLFKDVLLFLFYQTQI